MTTHPLLRSRLHPLNITSVEMTDDCPQGMLTLDPRLCWAAEIAELELVHVLNLGTGARLSAVVLFGQTGEVRLSGGPALGCPTGATIQISTVEAVPAARVPGYQSLLVRCDSRRNAPLELSRQQARPAPREPSFTPLAPRIVSTEPIVS